MNILFVNLSGLRFNLLTPEREPLGGSKSSLCWLARKHFGTDQPAAVIGNGLTPACENMFASVEELRAAKQNHAAYTTTPFRGLPVLLQARAR